MRLGLMGGGATADKVVEQAVQAEADGFSSVWYASIVANDPMVAIALAGRATSRIELGTAVLQTYPCHPILQANRALSVVDGMGRAGFALGIGPSHEEVVRGVFGASYDHPGRNTEEYVTILAALLRGEPVDVDGHDWSAHTGGFPIGPPSTAQILVAALGPRLLRVAGTHTHGVVLWMANAAAIERHVSPRLRSAADAAGRPEPRLVAGLPVAVHDDEQEARVAVQQRSTGYASYANYERILDIGGASTPADAAVVGDEAAVTRQLQALFDAGATEVYASVVGVGPDRRASMERTMTLLRDLAAH